jgi:hypothetical protein
MEELVEIEIKQYTMSAVNKDLLATLIDSHFNDIGGFVEGDVSGSAFSIPRPCIPYTKILPIDSHSQRVLVKKILPPNFYAEEYTKENALLYCIKTTGDGDCLLHAISLCMWGREDKYRLLRGLLSLTVASNEVSTQFMTLWCEEELRRDVALGYPGARDIDMLRNEFTTTTSVAYDVGR